jgi:hypothetical protein
MNSNHFSNGLPPAPREYDRYAPTGTVAKMHAGRVVYVPAKPARCVPLRFRVTSSAKEAK